MKHLIWALILLTGNAMAQNEANQAESAAAMAPAPPPLPCSSEQHHQFEFWVGEWDVTQNGQPAGHNIIRKVHDCALFENWTNAAGNFTCSSLNIYDQTTGKWHQTWVDVGGTLLQIDGGLVDGKMVMGSQTSSADGGTWTTAFNGLYVKVSGSE